MLSSFSLTVDSNLSQNDNETVSADACDWRSVDADDTGAVVGAFTSWLSGGNVGPSDTHPIFLLVFKTINTLKCQILCKLCLFISLCYYFCFILVVDDANG